MLKKTYLNIPIQFFLLIVVSQWCSCNFSHDNSTSHAPISVNYPKTSRDTTVADTFNGKRVTDPYRWLENSNNAASREWLVQQQTLTEKYLNRIPLRTSIEKTLRQMQRGVTFSPPDQSNNVYYVLQQERFQPQPVLYRLLSLRDTSRQVILDLNSPQVSGAPMLRDFAFSKDGSLLAYEVEENGARWNSIYIKDLESNRVLLDTLQGVQHSNIAWFRDGFFYSRYPQGDPVVNNAPYQFQQLFYHRVGSPQSDDELIFADRSNPFLQVQAQTTADERFLVLTLHQYSDGNALYVRDLQSETLDFNSIIESFDAIFELVSNVGNNLLVYTNYKAPNYRLIQINWQRPEEQFWETIVPEAPEILQSVRRYDEKLVATYTASGKNSLKIFDLRGKLLQELPLPDHGKITDWSNNPTETQAFFAFQPLTSAPALYALNVRNYSLEALRPAAPVDSTIEIRQVQFKSYDGTDIPMLILSKKGLKLDQQRPTLLSPGVPPFAMVQLILEKNGVCAIPQVRGSEGRGEAWRQAGGKTRRQNAFDDFQAAAEYLNANKFTNPQKLAIYGSGDGALVAGASLVQRPDLFRVALLDNGIYDLLRSEKQTIGWMWRERYGTITKSDELDALLAYSPLHNVVPARFPATLLLTSNRNQQVVPAHSYKFAAELQNQQQADFPILLRIAQGGAHRLQTEQISGMTDMLTFLFYHLEVDE